MKQIGFTPAGCSFWHKSVLAGNDKYFAYCSTTTIYIYNLEDFKCEKILSFSESNIMLLLWPITLSKKLLILTAAKKFYLCDPFLEEFSSLLEFENQPNLVDWASSNENLIAISLVSGFVKVYDIAAKKFVNSNEMDFTVAKSLKWNKTKENILAIGCNDGVLMICNIKGKNQKSNFERKDAILFLDWDNHSPNYLLIGHKNGEIMLVDSEKMSLLQSFEKMNSGISSLLWIKGIPGGFLTSSENLSTLKIWSVSGKSMMSNLKISSQPICNIQALSECQNGSFLFLISFIDKSIGVFDLNLKSLLFQTQPNHSETIFDAQINFKNPNILATSSYDGSIKIWNILNMKCLNTIEICQEKKADSLSIVKEAIVYGISWSPIEDSRLIAATYSGKILLVDTVNSKILKELKPGGNKPIHRIEWNKTCSQYIASGSKDGFFCVLNYKSKDNFDLMKKVKVNSEVYGVSWKEKMLAIGLKDGTLRVYEVNNGDVFLKTTLKGHTSKIFNISWHPLYPYILASGSDDKTIKIWNIKNNTNISLTGHMSFVRPLCWHYEIPWILLSGGWDANIKIWNTVSGQCLYTGIEHHSDIYAISSHPLRPNLFITGSRDNSIRLWDFQRFLDETQLSCLVLNKWENKFKESLSDYESLDTKEIIFYGVLSKSILKLYREIEPNLTIQFYQKVSTFFSFHEGEDDFWDIIFSILGGEKMKKKNEIVLINEIEHIYNQKIQNLEETSNKFFYDSKNKEKDRLIELADLNFKIGNFEKFCEIQIKLGKWEKALSFAPAVSMEYWESLVEKYSGICKETDLEESSFLNLISNHSLQAIKNFISAGNLEDAKLLATLLYTQNSENNREKSSQINNQSEDSDMALKKIKLVEIKEKLLILIENHAEKLLHMGLPILAASVHLSIKDGYSAVIKLIRANYMYEAYILAQTLKIDCLIKYLYQFFCNKIGKYNLLTQASNAIITSSPDINLIANYHIHNKEKIEEFSKMFQLPNNEALNKKIFTVTKNSLQYFEINLIISANDKNFDLIAEFLINSITVKKEENLMICFDLIEKIKFGKLLFYNNEKKKKLILAFAAFLAMKKAIWKGYLNMIVRFYRHLKKILQNSEIKAMFPLNFKHITMEYLNYLMIVKPHSFDKIFVKFKKNQTNYEESKVIEKKKSYLDNLDKEKLKQVRLNFARNKICLDDVNLPFNVSRTYQIKSIFTGENIKSTFYCLEDIKSFLEMEEALMWANCNVFSPLNTGYRIDPY